MSAIVDSFTPEQRAALWAAAHSPSWQRHPVNLRVGLRLFGQSFFITLVAGKERRNFERRRRDRRINPVRTLANLLFLVGVMAATYLLVVLGMVFFSLFIQV